MADQEKIVIEIETLIKTGQIDQARAKLRAFADDVILNNKRIEKSTKDALVNQDRRLRAMSGIQHAKAIAGDIPPGFFKKPITGTVTTKFPKGMVEGGQFVGIPESVRARLQYARDEKIWNRIAGSITRWNRWSPEMAEWQAWSKYQRDVTRTNNIEDILAAWHGRTGAGYHRLRGQPSGAWMMYSRALGGMRTQAGFIGSDIASIPKQTIEGMERAKRNAERAALVTPFDSIDDLVTSLQKKLDWMGQQARKSKDDLIDNEEALFTPLQGLANIYKKMSSVGKSIRGGAGKIGGWLTGPAYTNVSASVTGSFHRYLAGDKVVLPGMDKPITIGPATAVLLNKQRREQIARTMGKYGKITSFTERESDVMTKYGIRPITSITATFKAGNQHVDVFSAKMAKLRKELGLLPHAMDPVIRFQYTNNQMLDKGTLLSRRFAEMGSKSRKLAWGFTWMSMSMLGVYFSMNNLINLGMKGFSLFTQKLMDLEGTLTAFAMLQAFGPGLGLDMEKFGVDIDKVIQAWMNLMGLFSAGTVLITDLAADVFGDPAVIEAFGNALEKVTIVTKDPEFRDSIKTLAINVADIVGNLIEFMKIVIPLISIFTGIKIGDVNLATVFLILSVLAVLLMPILADLAAVILIVGKVCDLFGWALSGVGIASLDFAGIIAFLGANLAVIVIIVLVVMEAFGLWKYVVSALTWAVAELIVKGLELAKVLDWVFNAGRNQAYWDVAINNARNYWENYNRGLMDTQGGLLSIINYSRILGNIQLPTFPAWGGGTTGYGGLEAARERWAEGEKAVTQLNTITNNYNFGGVNATPDQIAEITNEQTRKALEMLMTKSSGYQGV